VASKEGFRSTVCFDKKESCSGSDCGGRAIGSVGEPFSGSIYFAGFDGMTTANFRPLGMRARGVVCEVVGVWQLSGECRPGKKPAAFIAFS
jgi:hypothetical protein